MEKAITFLRLVAVLVLVLFSTLLLIEAIVSFNEQIEEDKRRKEENNKALSKMEEMAKALEEYNKFKTKKKNAGRKKNIKK